MAARAAQGSRRALAAFLESYPVGETVPWGHLWVSLTCGFRVRREVRLRACEKGRWWQWHQDSEVGGDGHTERQAGSALAHGPLRPPVK